MSEPDDELLRRYLLGLVPEGDAEAIEEAYLASPEAFERVRGIEDDLLDDHAAGRLSAAEKAAFESRYLASNPLRQRVMAARALHRAGASGAPVARPLPWRRTAWWTRPLAMAAVLLIGLLAWWLWPSSGPRTIGPPPPTSIARAETPSPQPTAQRSPSAGPSVSGPATRRLALLLSPTLLRGEGGPAEVRIAPGIDVVTLELQGDRTAAPAGARLEVAIETVEGDHVWSGPGRREGRASLVASAEVPAERLGPGDYLATLSARGQTLHRYFFRVPRR